MSAQPGDCDGCAATDWAMCPEHMELEIVALRGDLERERERSANLLESVLDLRDETKRLAGLGQG